MGARDSLTTYREKRDFKRTPEPHAVGRPGRGRLSFVIQKHDASHLHYDFRLELDGTLKSWAVPKGPSLDPAVKRMAVEVEDHPLSYAAFEGTIPAGEYGAGTVIVWDRGDWLPEGDAAQGLAAGKLKFELRGEKLRGRWTLVRMRGKDEKKAPWLLIKERDGEARPAADYDILEALPDSVLTPAAGASGEAAPQPATKKRAGAKKARAAEEGGDAEEAEAADGADGAAGAGASARARKAAAPLKTEKAQTAPTSRQARKPRTAPEPVPLPESLVPQLATLAAGPPGDAAEWLWELKFDGYRIVTRIEGSRAQCFTRNGHDWTARMPELAAALGRLKLRSAWLDGEIVVMEEDGRPAFQSLQNAFERRSTTKIVYWIFDLPFLDGEDLRELPLEERRARLAGLLGEDDAPRLRFSENFDAPPRDLLESVTRLGFEGVIGKRKGSPYVSRRSLDWIKLKGGLRQEFVLVGYTQPKGVRENFGALLLGVYDEDGALRYCGNVGTGFDGDTLDDVKAQLDRLATRESPFAPGEVPVSVKAQWVKPRLVAEVSFGEWTRDARVRHAVFQGLRTDKPARQIVRERPVKVENATMPRTSRTTSTSTAPPARPAAKTAPAPARITHAERVIDAQSGITKGYLAAYYSQVAELILPHLAGRPVSLVRAPEGIGGELFFQKHAKGRDLPGVELLDPALDPGHDPLLQIGSLQGLMSAAQMNVIELHTWNATSDAIDRPDRFALDLDPGEGVAWSQVQEAATLVRTLLEEVGLVAFLKTSGGKGLHVVVPLRRHFGWDAVKGFSQALVAHLARTIPQRFSARSGAAHRVGKVFVDYLRNGFGATTASAWSARSRPGMGVSVPVSWDELPMLESGAHWTLRSIGERIAVGNGPWSAMEASRKGLAAPMRQLGFDPKMPK
jgi:bifunctional non-homologous end joining protein LigD